MAASSTRSVDGSAAIDLVMRFIRAGHHAGYPAAELEERVVTLAKAVGIDAVEISVTPTLVEISLGSLPGQRTFTLRVRPSTVDLDAVARLDEIAQDVLEGVRDADGALAALADVEKTPLERPWPILVAAYGLAGAALTPVLGGGWREAVAAAAVGVLVGGLAVPAQRAARTGPIVAPIAAIGASFSAAVLATLGLDAAPDLVTLAALVTFLPGMTLTIGMRELATEHLQSGVANTASALVQLLGLVFGVGVGRSIASDWFGPASDVVLRPPPTAAQVVGALAAGVAFTLTLRARYRDAVLMCSATVLALAANEAGEALFGKQAAVFVASLAVGLVGGLVGLRLRRSPLVFLVPGVLILVPGSAGFNSVLQLLTGQTVSGIDAGFETFATAMSIAYGLMVSAVAFPGQFATGRAKDPGS